MVVTTMSTAPAACAGVVAVMTPLVMSTLKEVAATPPNLTSEAFVMFVPLIVTCVPPVDMPLEGLTDVRVVFAVGGLKINTEKPLVIVPIKGLMMLVNGVGGFNVN